MFENGTIRRGSYDKILDLDTVTEINEWKETGELEKFKPYLRPMSSITEKEKQERYKFSAFNNIEVFDWYNAHHFDYRGLILMGLALPAPEEMYK